MAPKVRSMKIKKKIQGGSRLVSGSGSSSVVVELPTTGLRKPGSTSKGNGVNSLGSEPEPSPLKEDSALSGQESTVSPGSNTLEGYKQLVEYLRTVARVIEGICDKNDLLGEQSTEMVDGLLDATESSSGGRSQRNKRSRSSSPQGPP